MNAYATINHMQEISWNTSYLLSNINVGIGEITGMGYHVSNMQMMQTDESQLMTSQGSHAKQSHKLITQIECTRQHDIMVKNGNLK